MPSYHLLNGVGPAVKCAHDPCKLHGGSDFQAANQEQANVVGEQLMNSMYGNVKVDGLETQKNDAISHAKMKTSEVLKDAGDDSLIGTLTNDVADNAMRHAGLNESASFSENRSEIDAAMTNYVMNMGGMPKDEADKLVESYPGSFTALRAKAQDLYMIEDDGEPTAQQLSAAAILDRYQDRINDRMSDSSAPLSDKDRRAIRRDAGAVISGKTDLDAGYLEGRKARLQELENEIGNGNLSGDDLENARKEIKKCHTDIKRGTMPAAVRHRVIQNAWKNASPYARRKAIASMDPDVLRHAPPEAMARSLRHRDEDQRFAILNKIGERDKNAMSNIIINGGIGKSDAMTWINRHKVSDSDGNVNETNRMVNAYLRANFTRPGHARYSQSAETRTIAKMRDTSNFLDKNGEYSPRKHAQALYDIAYGTGAKMKDGRKDEGYLPLATKIISRRALPRKAMIEFAALSAGHDETRTANSRYNNAYAASHKDRKTGEPVMMKRWHTIRSFMPRLYGDVEREGRALHRNREANAA